MNPDHRSAVVLFSGGLDSTTLLAESISAGFTAYALTIDYGQRHRAELDAARTIANKMGVERHVVLDLDLRAFGGSALTADVPVPKHDHAEEIGQGIPVTYVPARNTIFLSLAMAWAETLGANDLFIGVNALDYSGYPDCRPEFMDAFRKMAHLATKAGVEGAAPLTIHSPLIEFSKSQIISRGMELGVDYAETVSCYDPDDSGAACGRCDSCLLRQRGFQQAGVPDPTRYQEAV
jgi:7-cyano-7-deazaguanine synthase